jgi:2,4-dienoyl-CoA reductase-like NADH-dependent reductase (Old Yellow Enzyme family)/thioredoxin reductase
MEIPNRIIMSPMITNFAQKGGEVSDQTIAYYKARARGGVGWIIVESAYVHRAGIMYVRQLGLDDDKYIRRLKDLTESIKREGARISIQLYHGGRRAQSDLSGYAAEAPSAIPLYQGAEPPRELTPEDIEDRISAYVKAAIRAKEAGFDGVDIHAGHGYLICAFLAKFTNQRSDKFGGDIRGRARFLTEVLKRIRREAGEDFVITARINGSDFVSGGLTHYESKEVARLVEASGANALQVTGGHGGLVMRDISEIIHAKNKTGARSLKEAGLKLHDQIEFDLHEPITFMRALPMGAPRGCFAHLARGIKASVNIPVGVVGRINRPEVAESILQRGDADMTIIGRALLADPEWPNKAAKGEQHEIRPCIGCQYGCFNNLFNRRAVQCATNPYTGKESSVKITSTSIGKHVMVVGAGPGGLEAAITAAKRGHSVTLYDGEDRIGGQLNVASVPPDRDEIKTLISYYENQVTQAGVNLKLGKRITWDDVKAVRPDVLVMATGSVPVSPPIEGDARTSIVQAVDVLGGRAAVSGKVVVVGGGLVGCGVADFLANEGFKVALVEMLDTIGGDEQPDDRNFIAQKIIEYNLDIYLMAEVQGFIPGEGLLLKTPQGEQSVAADTVVLATGLEPLRALIDQLEIEGDKTPIDGKEVKIYSVGDCNQPRKILEAIHEGAEVGLSV